MMSRLDPTPVRAQRAPEPGPRLGSLHPLEAWELLRREPQAVLIDVRSTPEYLLVGHPVGAIHIPWMDEPDWSVNPDFVREVRRTLLGGAPADRHHPNVPLLLICRSGKRSREAGEALLRAGFTRVFNIEEGFEGPLDAHHHRGSLGGWRFYGLPWEQC